MKKMLRLPQQPWRLHWNATFLCLCFLTGCMRGSKDLCSVYWFHMTESPSNLTLTPEGKRKHLMFTCFYPSEKSVGSFSSNSLSNEYSCIHAIQLLFIEFEFIEQLWHLAVYYVTNRGNRHRGDIETMIAKCHSRLQDRAYRLTVSVVNA